MTDRTKQPLTAAHWGVYRAEVAKGKLQALHPFEHDPDPSPIARGYLDVLDDQLRIKTPMVRKSWIEGGPGAAPELRGKDPFVEVSWERAEKLVADELQRVRTGFGNQAIYGGSYGWSGAGRFHHAQSQLHRFLNTIGGYTRSVNTYSHAAGEVILSHVVGDAARFIHSPPSWRSVVKHTELLVSFGGMPLRNSQISAGGTGRHRSRDGLIDAKRAGVSFVNISPTCSDVSDNLGAQWLPARPGSDVAIMLGLAHELLRNNLHDIEFLQQYTEGFDRFADYLRGEPDGVEKNISWAAEIADVSAEELSALARRMSVSRTIISTSWSLTRQENGEQPFWMATTLAAMLGQLGLPGGGVAYGYCAANSIGNERRPTRFASLPQLSNPVKDFIPVARISDMLLNPGQAFHYNGQTLTYPDVKLVYWAGGNPFHHHQDLSRLCRAWEKPDSVIVHEWCWNALAKRADIVLPCTTQLERDDVMLTPRDPFIVAMVAVVEPVGNARNDYDIFCGIARHLGVQDIFTAGRSADEWQRWIYDESRKHAETNGVQLPDYDEFRQQGWHEIEAPEIPADAFTAFRKDPDNAPLKTPTGKIQISSSAIESFPNTTILPHPAWYEPVEWLGNASDERQFHLDFQSARRQVALPDGSRRLQQVAQAQRSHTT